MRSTLLPPPSPTSSVLSIMIISAFVYDKISLVRIHWILENENIFGIKKDTKRTNEVFSGIGR